MLLEIPKHLETHIIHQAGEQGMDPSQYALQILAQYTTPFDYDLDRMKERLKGFETKEKALENGVAVPDFETLEELKYWTRHILPTLRATV